MNIVSSKSGVGESSFQFNFILYCNFITFKKREPCDANTLRVQYYQQNDTYKALLHYMNTTLTGLFTLECIMKIFSFGFRVTMPTMVTTNTMPMPTMPTNTMPSTATSKNNCKQALELEGAINNLVPVKKNARPVLSCPKIKNDCSTVGESRASSLSSEHSS